MSEPSETPIGRLLAAASLLAQASSGLIENALAETLFTQDVADFAANPNRIHPLGDDLDAIAEAITCIHFALGEPSTTSRLADAAERWVRGED
jgi:hypothetical protein